MARNNSLEMGELTDGYYYILLSLVKPKHGYLIMKSIEEMSKGNFSIGPASLYTSIKKLLNGNLIKLDGEAEQKKIYSITEKGMEALKKEIKKKREMIEMAEKIFNSEELL